MSSSFEDPSLTLRVVQNYIVNFKHENFVADLVDYHFLGQKHSKIVKILKIEQFWRGGIFFLKSDDRNNANHSID